MRNHVLGRDGNIHPLAATQVPNDKALLSEKRKDMAAAVVCKCVDRALFESGTALIADRERKRRLQLAGISAQERLRHQPHHPKSKTPVPMVGGVEDEKRMAALRLKYAHPGKRDAQPSPVAAAPKVQRSTGAKFAGAPRRTFVDELVSPLKCTAFTPTPGPAMLPYLELFESVKVALPTLTTSDWNRAPPRERTLRSEVTFRPVYGAPNLDVFSPTRSAAIGLARRDM